MQHIHLLNALSQIRAACVKHLSIGHSLIPFDILMAVLIAEQQGNHISVKELFLKLPYSDMGIRYHLRKLTDDDWIETTGTNGDKRVKVIISKPKLQSSFDMLSHQIKSIITPPRN